MKNTVKKITSASGGVINKDKLVLVINQRRKFWSLPKGHVGYYEQKNKEWAII